MNTLRTCQTCAAFNSEPLQDEPTCWNLVSTPAGQPVAGGCCPDHRDEWEDAQLNAVLAQLPFDQCGDNAEAQLAARIKAMDSFNSRMYMARKLVSVVITKASGSMGKPHE